ncbi:hypothetical protein EVG20_g6161 [Dentipellis fragilis]|uniref:Vacuolar sorting protein Vps3844 C-terminal domain-containing protein n=1 Tax=Dentipellis fragilis TaxID=205917 RepID=A0A4Y9YPZ4_9AGAM|nr:hypothetical protein EVG20_g6161 [Dentipellis fragilis]
MRGAVAATRPNNALAPTATLTTMRSIAASLLLASFVSAADVYLHPSVLSPSQLSTSHASAALARHLQLDSFEPLSDNDQITTGFLNEPFVGQGERSSLLLSIEGPVAKDVIPDTLSPAFSLAHASPLSSFSRTISTSLERAAHAFSHIYSTPSDPHYTVPHLLDAFSIPSSATERYLSSLAALTDFLESDADSTDKFGAFEMLGLADVAAEFGRASEQYALAAEALRAALLNALSRDDMQIAVLTTDFVTVPSREKRAPQQSPLPPQISQAPLGSDAACFATADACANATNTCTGRGECVQTAKLGRTCFVCACSATKNAQGRTEHWAGDACQRKDVSGPFVLITGTVIGLVVLIGGSVSLLYSIGSNELPSVLTGGLAHGSKRD